MHAWYSGAPAVVAFVVLMRRRIAVEERALGDGAAMAASSMRPGGGSA
jgi:hypothetical protein